MKMKKRNVIGEYNRYGYTIMLDNGCVLYFSGNHPNDSYQTLMLNDPLALLLKKIRSMCIKTGKEIAAERKYIWGGAERIEEGT